MVKLGVDLLEFFFAGFDTPVVQEMLKFVRCYLAVFLDIKVAVSFLESAPLVCELLKYRVNICFDGDLIILLLLIPFLQEEVKLRIFY